MKASNEEMQSTNEELRSTMEELETSKEELQSMNEELQTVNQENRHKVEELAQLSSDLQNLLAATDITTLFLDRKLRIMRFTPKVGELFNVRMTDRGRPISELTHRLGYDQLQADATEQQVQKLEETGHIGPHEKEYLVKSLVELHGGRWRSPDGVLTKINSRSTRQASTSIWSNRLNPPTYSEFLLERVRRPCNPLNRECAP